MLEKEQAFVLDKTKLFLKATKAILMFNNKDGCQFKSEKNRKSTILRQKP